MVPNPDYRMLTLADVNQAAQVISQAFEDDPLCTFMLPRKRTRSRTLYRFFQALGELSIKNQRGYGSGDPLQGVAYWKLPNQESMSVSIKSLGKFVPLLFTPYPIGLVRARAVLDRIDSLHEKHADGSHFYLDNLGVLPSARGKGVSSKLIRPFLEMADTERAIVYTDTVTLANVPLYEHFGFQCVEQSPVSETGLTVFALRRPAR